MNKSNEQSNIQIGKLLQAAREQGKVSQQEIADTTDMSKNHISAIERGVSKASIELLLGYCKKLDVTPNEILGYSEGNIIPELRNLLNHASEADQRKIIDIFHLLNKSY